ncbi:MAG: sporulation protein [Intestinibacter bartlettii]|nr:sporulation protein [Intestinibacter bartlettii]
MQVKKSCDLNLTGKMYVCINGKRFKLDLSCASIFDTLKWFNKNNCPNKFPSINDDKDDNDNIEDNNQNNGNNQDNNQGGNMEDNNQGNNNQDKDDNNPGNDNNQDQDKDDNNPGNDNNQDQDKDDNNQDNNNNQDQDKDDNNQDNNNNQDQDKDDNNQNDDNNSSNINGFSKEQVEVLNLVNKERKANGLKPLTLNKELSNVANIKSRDMIEKGYFDHTSPTYGSPFDMMKKFNISYNTAGENIAMGQKTPSEVMNSWMNSSGHRANILNSTYTELGVGIQKDSNGTIYWTQMFIGR